MADYYEKKFNFAFEVLLFYQWREVFGAHGLCGHSKVSQSYSLCGLYGVLKSVWSIPKSLLYFLSYEIYNTYVLKKGTIQFIRTQNNNFIPNNTISICSPKRNLQHQYLRTPAGHVAIHRDQPADYVGIHHISNGVATQHCNTRPTAAPHCPHNLRGRGNQLWQATSD